MGFRFTKKFNENLFIKVFVLFMALIFFISISFTVLFIRNQTNVQTESLIKYGRLLAEFFAGSFDIIVYVNEVNADGKEAALIPEDAFAHIKRVEGVLGFALYDEGGKSLYPRGIPSEVEEAILDRGGLKNNDFLEPDDFGNFYVFRSPVFSFSSMPDPVYGITSDDKDGIAGIGILTLFVDKKNLRMQMKALLVKGILIWIVFLLLGSLVAFFLARGVTQPLYRLTEGVKTLGEAGSVQKISIETKDEVGKLAQAFNHMSESLIKRQAALADSENTLRFLSGQLLKAQEMERKRLSIELHDELGQGLALLKHRFRQIGTQLSEDDHSASSGCQETIQDIDRVIENVRRLSRDLSPSILEDLGLSAAIKWMVERFQKQYGVGVDLDFDNVDALFLTEEQTNIYRMFQEMLNNIGKHAEASLVKVSARIEQDNVIFIVQDDGKGFDLEGARTLNIAERGIGLAALDERANMLRGTLYMQSRPHNGTWIELKVPITKAETKNDG